MGVSIAVHSFKGGTGKSTITSNIAVSLAIRGWRVGVMDMDLEGPGLHVIFNIDPADVQATLNDVLMGGANPGQAVIRLNDKLGLKTGELYFMPASTNVTAMLRTLRTGFEIVSFMKALESLQKLFELDYVFIVSAPNHPMAARYHQLAREIEEFEKGQPKGNDQLMSPSTRGVSASSNG